MSHRDIGEAMWCALRNPEIRRSLLELQADVNDAADLSLLRVLDIVLWMSAEG